MTSVAAIRDVLPVVLHAGLVMHSITNHHDRFLAQPLNACMIGLLLVACAMLRGQSAGCAG